MDAIAYCEKKLALRIESAPGLSKPTKHALVQWLPTISITLALVTAIGGWLLWNRIGAIDRFSFVADVGIYVVAYRALTKRRKLGWNLLFYGTLVQIVYGALALLVGEGTWGGLVGRTIGVALTGYVLLQLRPMYMSEGVGSAAGDR